MITSEQELQSTIERISWMQQQLAHLRNAETNAVNYKASAGGFLAEIDRMHLEVREYLSSHPAEPAVA